MQAIDLNYQNLTSSILKPYEQRANTDSARFLRWFLENIYRLDEQDADDAAVDGQQDKGIDGIYVNETTDTVYLIQVKTRQKANATLGDTEIKNFVGSLQQFKSGASIQAILAGQANEQLKLAIKRWKLAEKVESGFAVEGVFCTNLAANKDATSYLATCGEIITLYDASRIADEFIEINSSAGIDEEFVFDVSDTDVLKYDKSATVRARLFLANSLQLTHLKGITDGTLFERNVRLALGNTKINSGLVDSINSAQEHKNFPLYHNGITILCDEFTKESDHELGIRNYVVVNGAQSLTSLFATKSKLSTDLRILVRAIEVKGDHQLADKITLNSNNQNAIKPRDLRSNHGIQQRLKSEISAIPSSPITYEVKRGEKSTGKLVLSNEDAGLLILAMDLGEPWNCHQKYKVMDESHAKIFGRPDITGWKIIGLFSLFTSTLSSLSKFDDKTFGYYTLTRYFLAYAVAEIIKDSALGRTAFRSFRQLIEDDKLHLLMGIVESISLTTADDLNAEIAEAMQSPDFDYKAELKSPNWCRAMAGKLKAQYKKDVSRKKTDSVDVLLAPLGLA